MTSKKLLSLQTGLELLLMCITYFAIMAGVYLGILGKSDHQIGMCFIILIPVLLTYIMRRKIRKFFLFIVGHVVIVIAAIVLGHNDLDATLYFLSAAIVCVHSIRLKMRLVDKNLYMNNPTNIGGDSSEETAEMMSALSASERMSPYYAIAMVVFYIYAGYKNMPFLQNIEVVLFVLFVIIQILYNQLQNVNKVFYTNRDKSEFPAKQMARINLIIAVLIVVLMIFGMLLFYYGPYGNVFTIAGGILFAVFKFFMKMILAIWGSGPSQSSTQVEEESTTAEELDFSGPGEPVEGSHIAEALAETVGIVLLLVLVMTVIYMIIQYTKRASSSKQEGYDEVEFIKEGNSKEHFKDESMRREKKKEDNQNIAYRKIYKKKVIQGNHKKKPDETLPPEILTKDNITTEEEQARRVTESYEKARYSRENVSKDDVDYLKNL